MQAQRGSWGAGGGRCPEWHHQPRKQAEEPKGPGDDSFQGLGNKEEGKQRSLPDFVFLFAMQKKGSGFFFCAKHAPALRAAGAVLRECNPAPPVCMALVAPPSPAVRHRIMPQATAPFEWVRGVLRNPPSSCWDPAPCLCNAGLAEKGHPVPSSVEKPRPPQFAVISFN